MRTHAYICGQMLWDNSSFDDVLSALIKDGTDNPFQSSHPGNFMLMDSIKILIKSKP